MGEDHSRFFSLYFCTKRHGVAAVLAQTPSLREGEHLRNTNARLMPGTCLGVSIDACLQPFGPILRRRAVPHVIAAYPELDFWCWVKC